MDWLGIGVLIIGIAFLAFVIMLIKPLKNLSGVFSSLRSTTDALPQQVADITSGAKDTLTTGRETIQQLNNQMSELSPIFTILGDVGETTNKLSSSMVDITKEMKANTKEGSTFIERKNLEGLYGAITLGYYAFQRRNP
ncbi:Uncharacterized protein YoxC, contains an MCP-like domain [Virgibacillus subterraneus]|uniref:Uncharacterized protein YoxC, contains an MCP-like domain n=1 Tax=Virgibacillus subterraneus TaxID=621109 RepID=A0A1H9KX74_9BACI|nr:DUF948 domain-containing protein [Virgibacillus subterraneus]SER03545.1 Uncharacterized protein YoxC, contains an MCP-like domain [Virgibacillus subterraneus]